MLAVTQKGLCGLWVQWGALASIPQRLPWPPTVSSGGRERWGHGTFTERPHPPQRGVPQPPLGFSRPSQGCKTAPPEGPFHPRGDLGSDQMVSPWQQPQLSENRSGLIRFRRWSHGGPAVVPEGPCLFDFPAQTHLFKQTPQGLQ